MWVSQVQNNGRHAISSHAWAMICTRRSSVSRRAPHFQLSRNTWPSQPSRRCRLSAQASRVSVCDSVRGGRGGVVVAAKSKRDTEGRKKNERDKKEYSLLSNRLGGCSLVTVTWADAHTFSSVTDTALHSYLPASLLDTLTIVRTDRLLKHTHQINYYLRSQKVKVNYYLDYILLKNLEGNVNLNLHLKYFKNFHNLLKIGRGFISFRPL